MVRSILGCWHGRRRPAGNTLEQLLLMPTPLPEIVWSCLLFLLITVDPDIHITDLITTLLRVCVPFFNSFYSFYRG